MKRSKSAAHFVFLVLITLLALNACDANQNQQKQSQAPPAVKETPPPGGSDLIQSAIPGHPSYLAILDATGFEIVAAKTPNEFIGQQAVKFQSTPDTVINDERGVFVGQRLTYKDSFLQWLDRKRVTRMVIVDPEIQLKHGIHCRMTKSEFIRATQFDVSRHDTLELQTGFLQNRTEFYFANGELTKVVLENLPD